MHFYKNLKNRKLGKPSANCQALDEIIFFLKKNRLLCICSYSWDVGFYSGNNWSSRRKKSFWTTITGSLPKQATFFRLNTLETYDCNREKTTPNIFLLYTRKAMGSMIYPSHPQLSSGFYHFPTACMHTTLSTIVIEPNLACSCSARTRQKIPNESSSDSKKST